MKPLFLLADDFAPKRSFLQSFIEKQLDVELLLATTSEEAFERIHEHMEITFAFIDYEIPTQNGPSIIKELTKQHPNCKVALVTASPGETYKQNALDAGATGYICTTWPLDQTESAITHLLDQWNTENNSQFLTKNFLNIKN